MNDVQTKRPLPLPLPVVPMASQDDGLLKTSDLAYPVAVQVEVWAAAEPKYYFQLMLNGELVGDTREITESDKPGDVITVYLSEQLLTQNGSYQLGYMASSPFSESHVPSSQIPLRVDRTPPGAALLAPLIVPNATFGNHLTALLPGYAGMEPGDTIQTLCNGHPGPTHIVQPDELTLRPIEIVFEREVMQSLAADNVAISYTVTDRAGNLSIESLPVNLSLNM